MASSLIVRVVSLAPHRPRQFLVLSCGGTSYTSLEVDENGLFAQQVRERVRCSCRVHD